MVVRVRVRRRTEMGIQMGSNPVSGTNKYSYREAEANTIRKLDRVEMSVVFVHGLKCLR